jgi:AP-3 complex subunit beta
MFQQHQKSFYVHSTDSIHVKLLKLEILTCLANESNISIILREFQVQNISFVTNRFLSFYVKKLTKAYVLSNDKEFAAATIHAIGRCASSIKEVADNCLTGLVNLMSKKDGKVNLLYS